uniref:VWFA domain-containing protein n=1 Tax=Romanomermis culicivorax TaxID=13658 RepID=A0A915L1E3_ROMCU
MHLNEKFCKDRKSILHLLIHVLGFDHENVRPDAGLYSTLLYSPDRHFEMAFNSSLHHNSYTYMPYNWRSIMHITPPVPLLMPKREGRQLRFGKRSLKPQGYQMQIYGPRFSDWFPNDLGQLDLNNLNRHYHCGEHSPLCRDHFGLENCTRYGLGASTLGGLSLNVANHAQCSNDYFARHQCPKTCGTCALKVTRKNMRAIYTPEISQGNLFPLLGASVVIVVTDGHSQDDPVSSAEALRNAGVIILVVGIGEYVNMAELLEVALDREHTF